MSIVCLLNGLCHRFVDSECHGAEQGEERQVGEHADHREAGNGQQCDQPGAKNNAGFFHIAPVDEGFHWKYKNSKSN